MRVRHDPPARARRRGRPRAARPGRLRGAGDHLRRQDLGPAPREGDPGLARGEPGDDRRLDQLRPRRGQAGDLRRRALLRRLARRPRATRSTACAPRPPPGPRTSRSATPTAPASRARSPRRPRPSSPSSATASQVGIHTHNDAECGVANSLAAVEAGARMVQGTVNGYGERCGNANLISILPALQLKLGYECVPDDRMRLLSETAHFVDELTNTTPDPDQPYVGRNAFAHKGGMHVAGVQADARTFEHLDPKLVGNSRDVLISELSGQGIGALARRGRRHRPRRRRRQARARHVKEREHRGYHYEAANASFELLLRREAGAYQPLFRLEGYRVIVEKNETGIVDTRGDDQDLGRRQPLPAHGRGRGPVNALDKALRLALEAHHPHLPTDRADQLQGPADRRRPRDRTRSRASCWTPPIARTSGARSASRRTSSRPPGRPSWTRSSTPSSPRPARHAPGFACGGAGVWHGRADAREGSAREALARRA